MFRKTTVPSIGVLRLALLTLIIASCSIIPAFSQGGIALGNGKLTYSVSSSQSTCGGGTGPANSMWTWTYSNFSYNYLGSSYPLSGSTTLVYSYHPYQMCPPNLLNEPITLQLPSSLMANCNIVFDPTYNPSSGVLNATATMCGGITGGFDPKYVVLGIYYAPPGSQSYVSYATSGSLGTGTSIENSFSNANTSSVTLSGSATTAYVSASASDTSSSGWTYMKDDSATISLLDSYSDTTQLNGATNDGVQHSADVIWVWLNPVVAMTYLPPVLQTGASPFLETGLAYDSSDPCLCMDVIPLTLAQLQGGRESITNPNILTSLNRSWAPTLTNGNAPALTDADLQAIAAFDPFSIPSYAPTFVTDPDGSVCSTDGRFCQPTASSTAASQDPSINEDFPYVTGITRTVALSSVTTNTGNTSATNSSTSGYSTDDTLSISAGNAAIFQEKLSLELKQSNTLTWTNKHTTQESNSNGTSGTLNIVGPSDSTYVGPTEFTVYVDNVYGTFMFWPVN